VETPSSPVDVFGDTTWTPHPNLVRVTTTSDMPITLQRARELARGLREQFILGGNEDSPGEDENEDIIVDVREEERDVPE
jgi:hypothetical protein